MLLLTYFLLIFLRYLSTNYQIIIFSFQYYIIFILNQIYYLVILEITKFNINANKCIYLIQIQVN